MAIVVNKPLPEFEAIATGGIKVSNSSHHGQMVVLYFYPKDNTPGCTEQACGFRDTFPKFTKGKAVVLGVSTDSVKKHANFRKKYALPFTLLADTKHDVAEAYGVWVPKILFGHKYMGITRTTFVIDARGKIRRVFEEHGYLLDPHSAIGYMGITNHLAQLDGSAERVGIFLATAHPANATVATIHCTVDKLNTFRHQSTLIYRHFR